MRITPLLQIPQGTYKGLFTRSYKKEQENNDSGDVFVRTKKSYRFPLFSVGKKTPEINHAVQAFFDNQDKFQISDFYKLSQEELWEIERKINLEYTLHASRNVTFAEGLKEMLDEKYGKDGYVFVSIGTSPSLIAKVMECMGVETKYLPMSKLSTEDIDDIIQQKDFSGYAAFLETQGITTEKLNSTDKKYIFYDYTSSLTQRSLRKFERLAKEVFRLPEDKIEFRSINRDLLDLFKGKIYIDERDAVLDYIDNYFGYSKAETYSTVNSLPIREIDMRNYSPSALSKHNSKDTKYYNFCVMKLLSKRGLLEENPANANAL